MNKDSDIIVSSFHRVNVEHILDLYTGYDEYGRKTLLLIAENTPLKMNSSNIIEVQIGLRQDTKWAISFILKDIAYLEMFECFCDDIIKSSSKVKTKKLSEAYVCSRYLMWQKMLKQKKLEILSYSKIKGLIGELYFLKYKLIPLIGKEKAINAWIGPSKAKQDFVCDDTWYEIKTTHIGSKSVNITSVEQLDVQCNGHLIVLCLEDTSMEYKNKITLNNLIEELEKDLDDDLLCVFLQRLFEQGYVHNTEYDKYCFRFSKLDSYFVTKTFPCLRYSDIPGSVKNIKYELLLNDLISYKE